MKIDDQTWSDLLLNAYCDRIGAAASLVGRESLRDRLRHGAADLAAVRERVRGLMDDGALAKDVSAACAPLSACDTSVAGLLAEAPDGQGTPLLCSAPRWAPHLWLLPTAFVLSALFALFWWPLWLVVLAGWLLVMTLQVSYHSRMQTWQALVNSMQAMQHTHGKLAQLPSSLLNAFRPDADSAARLRRALARTPLTRIPLASEYLDWILLDNLRHYFRTRQLVSAHRELLRGSYELVAAIDADLALSQHLRASDTFCWAGEADAIHLQQVVHPLLENPQPLSIALDGGAFISGQNGVGKSTLLRTIGLNLLTARAFGFCYAEQARVPFTPVCASMKSEDALEQGESLYLAELRRAREMLALANSGQRTVFLIDEIFRGTNHLESVSAGAAVLHALAEKGVVLVSSHNLTLGTLLAVRLQALCVRTEDGKLLLEPGILRQTNGIFLLRDGGFDPAIEAHAQQVYAMLAEQL